MMNLNLTQRCNPPVLPAVVLEVVSPVEGVLLPIGPDQGQLALHTRQIFPDLTISGKVTSNGWSATPSDIFLINLIVVFPSSSQAEELTRSSFPPWK